MVLFFLNVRIAGIFFENCTNCTDFFENCTDLKKIYGFVKKNVRIVRIFFSKIVRIVRIFFQKLYGLYGFPLKMYGFFQKSFGHPGTSKLLYNVQVASMHSCLQNGIKHLKSKEFSEAISCFSDGLALGRILKTT